MRHVEVGDNVHLYDDDGCYEYVYVNRVSAEGVAGVLETVDIGGYIPTDIPHDPTKTYQPSWHFPEEH